VARAKHTDRAEARRRYRQATSQPVDAEDLETPAEEPAPARGGSNGRAERAKSAREPQAPARPGFGSAFRAAYHPANVREDLRLLPRLLRHWAFLLPTGLIAVGAVVATIWWNYTGGQLIFQLLVYPGSGFGVPQLITGFFAPRASYLLGFIVSIIQGIAAILFAFNISSRLGTPITNDALPGLLTQAFLAGPLSGMLFAAAAAWYRRFLALSSPRRAAARQQQAKSSKGTPSRRPAGR
jgi:hypothetical protein